MGVMRIKIEDEVDRAFRTKIAELGGKKGSLSKYVEEAIILWMRGRE
ncbi:MAG: ribbon-helix-helix domain-containing protein [archaeon]|nr:ribbon-helix-helix domain-containing protein [archaeon]